MDIHPQREFSEGLPSFDELIANAPEAPAQFKAGLSECAESPSLIHISRESGKPSVDARDLHTFLEVGKDFSTWIKDRISQFGFVAGQDFAAVTHSPKSGSGNRGTKTDYALSLDMAKELSMVERTEKGKQARQYFIACEKKLEERPAPVDIATALSDPGVLRSLLLGSTEKILALETAVSELAPKAEALDRLATAGGSMCVTDAAKALQIRPRELFAWLDAHGWTYRRHGSRERVPYQHRIQSGDMEVKAYTYKDSGGEDQIAERALVTAKGLTALAKKLSKEVSQ